MFELCVYAFVRHNRWVDAVVQCFSAGGVGLVARGGSGAIPQQTGAAEEAVMWQESTYGQCCDGSGHARKMIAAAGDRVTCRRAGRGVSAGGRAIGGQLAHATNGERSAEERQSCSAAWI